jgi:hypothetical protein
MEVVEHERMLVLCFVLDVINVNLNGTYSGLLVSTYSIHLSMVMTEVADMIPSEFFCSEYLIKHTLFIVSHILSVARPERKIMNRAALRRSFPATPTPTALPEKRILVPSIAKVRPISRLGNSLFNARHVYGTVHTSNVTYQTEVRRNLRREG